ncbi:metallophosphoesterase [Cognatishimia sp. F0-27]|uniref:metallophosphoesterase n=1 Tax=Cognatishimia sp. F0-27 TaxID=2816855 RepID=UPI001D0C811D|nr:metallophosphoesterase [Cognatishimia sp. F0-27]MCC1492514.1 metallophosphoesterase [Cognatishimia sp. F0-27]
MTGKLLVLTDLHLTDPGQTIIGLDPAARSRAALSHAIRTHPDADALLLLGDLTHHGRPGQYSGLAALLSDIPCPVFATLGNHDDATAFGAEFPDQMTDGFACHALQNGGMRVLLLDTLDRDGSAPRHGGWLCNQRLDWLDGEMAAADGAPLLIACHHPPFATGFAGMDGIGLANPRALLDRLQAYRGPVQLLCGHVHRTISGAVEGIAFTTLKSPCHQMPMALSAKTTALSVDEPGAYGIALTGPTGAVIHSEDFAVAMAGSHDPDSA